MLTKIMVKKHLIKYYYITKNLPFLLFARKPKILSFEDTINKIVLQKQSIVRFGDGEIHMLLSEGKIGFQEKNQTLSERLNWVLSNEIQNLMVCLPDVFRLKPENVIDSQLYWLYYLLPDSEGRKFLQKIDRNRIYGDSGITRFYIAYKNKRKRHVEKKVKSLKKIWNGKDILIVEGSKTKLGVGNDLFDNAASIERILCPPANAFSKYNEILQVVKDYGKEKQILIALGPTATVLAYDLANSGYWAIDIGHVDIEYSWFKNGVRNKSEVKGKYVNERRGNSEDEELPDDGSYLKSIVASIKIN